MLYKDLENVESAINVSIERIRDSFQKIHGCQQSWDTTIEDRFLTSIYPLVSARKVLRENFNCSK